jgi:hypothetical protein
MAEVDVLLIEEQLDSDQFRSDRIISGSSMHWTRSGKCRFGGSYHCSQALPALLSLVSPPISISIIHLHYYYSSTCFKKNYSPTGAETRKIPNGLVVGVEHGGPAAADCRVGLAALPCAAVPAAKPQRKQSRQRTVRGTEDGTRYALFLRRFRTKTAKRAA